MKEGLNFLYGWTSMDTANRPSKKATKKHSKPSKKRPPSAKHPYTPASSPHPFHSFQLSPSKDLLLSFFTTNLSQQERMLASFQTPPFPKSKWTFSSPSSDLFWSPSLYHRLQSSLQTLRRLRGVFRRFLHRWRVSRLRLINTEDIVTLSPPKNPIWIVDWRQKQVALFEASTLMRDITTRLLEHDGFFEDAQPPRNPLTNLPLTQSQTISVWNQLARSPVTASSVFSEFRRVRWDLSRFVTEYAIPLELHAFRQTMRDTSHIDYRDRMVDFIQYCYDQESEDCFVASYSHALHRHPDHPLLQQWATLCTDFYEASILYQKFPDKLLKLQESVLDKTIPLLPRQTELQLLYHMYLRVRSRRERQLVLTSRTMDIFIESTAVEILQFIQDT